MKVLVFGASGSTGFHIVSQGLEKGHRVTAFVRDPSKMKIVNRHLQIFNGDVSDVQQIETAVRNQDVVISALGASNPFLRNVTLIKGVENIVKGMTKWGVKRFIYLSFLGVKEYRRDLGFLINKIIPVVLASVIRDHEEKEQIIRHSTLDWTIVRGAMLTNAEVNRNYKTGERLRSQAMVPSISRASVADFMLRQLDNPGYVRKKPRIMNR